MPGQELQPNISRCCLWRSFLPAQPHTLFEAHRTSLAGKGQQDKTWASWDANESYFHRHCTGCQQYGWRPEHQMIITKPCPKVEATIKERWDNRSEAQENLGRFLSPNLILLGISWRGYSSFLVWGGCIPERKGLAAPGMVLGRNPLLFRRTHNVHRGALGSGWGTELRVYLFCTHNCVSDTKQVCSLSCPPGTSFWGLLQAEHPQQKQGWLWCDCIISELKINNSKQQTRVLFRHDYCATDTVLLPGPSGGMVSEQKDLCSSPGRVAKAYTKLWPTTPTVALSEKSLLSIRCYESAASPLETPLFIPNKTEVTREQGIMPRHRSPSIFPYLHESSLFPGQASCICSSWGWRSSQPAPSVSSFPLTHPCSSQLPPFLQGSYAHSSACPLSPAFPKQPPKDRGWSLGIPPHPSQSSYPFLSRGMIFIRAIVFSFLSGFFSFSTASFKSAFPVSNTEPGWESKL